MRISITPVVRAFSSSKICFGLENFLLVVEEGLRRSWTHGEYTSLEIINIFHISYFLFIFHIYFQTDLNTNPRGFHAAYHFRCQSASFEYFTTNDYILI